MLTQEDRDFFDAYRSVQRELESRADKGELFLWSPDREVKIEAHTVPSTV